MRPLKKTVATAEAILTLDPLSVKELLTNELSEEQKIEQLRQFQAYFKVEISKLEVIVKELSNRLNHDIYAEILILALTVNHHTNHHTDVRGYRTSLRFLLTRSIEIALKILSH